LKSYLVDTNVISEWQKPRPQKSVLDFLLGAPKSKIFTSVICIAEIRKGIEAAPTPDLRRRLDLWLNNDLRPFFTKRILPASEDVVFQAIKLADQVGQSRASFNMADCWIAATAKQFDLEVVTRNSKDIEIFGVAVFNPWTGERFNSA
jgi:toxin FitB